MKLKVICISGIVLFAATLGGIFLWPEESDAKFEKTNYNEIDLSGIDNLMIIAHPDDDMLWGGAELINKDYLVVCITCGSSERRVKEFEAVMSETNDKYVMLGYPDKTNGERDNWDTVRDGIIDDVEAIYALKDWKMVLTHNPEGEYGHIHHKMTDAIVTDAVVHEKLFYFGKYYSRKELEEDDVELSLLDEDTLRRKEEILNLYVSQDDTIHKTFGHMLKSEKVISYEEWNELYGKETEE